MSKTIKCMLTCDQPAKAWVHWGLAPQQRGNLCEKHLKELWEMVHHARFTGIWGQRLPGYVEGSENL